MKRFLLFLSLTGCFAGITTQAVGDGACKTTAKVVAKAIVGIVLLEQSVWGTLGPASDFPIRVVVAPLDLLAGITFLFSAGSDVVEACLPKTRAEKK